MHLGVFTCGATAVKTGYMVDMWQQIRSCEKKQEEEGFFLAEPHNRLVFVATRFAVIFSLLYYTFKYWFLYVQYIFFYCSTQNNNGFMVMTRHYDDFW